MTSIRKSLSVLLAKIASRSLPSEERAYTGILFSSSGEDRILFELFRGRHPRDCFYVDIGANHPFRFSNTALFDRLGWHGLVVEPNPDLARLHQKFRPQATVCAEACGTQSGTVELITFPGRDALSTVDPAFALLQKQKFGLPDQKVLNVPCRPLREILSDCEIGHKTTFLDVDVEGHDLSVLESNDWSIYRPEAILIETSANYREIDRFLRDLDYWEYGRMGLNSIYLESEL
jgi:FkbM family methyltransferase